MKANDSMRYLSVNKQGKKKKKQGKDELNEHATYAKIRIKSTKVKRQVKLSKVVMR